MVKIISHNFGGVFLSKMKVIIVGAGIAGLGAGIGLRRAGHDVQVHLPSSNQFQARESNKETQQS